MQIENLNLKKDLVVKQSAIEECKRESARSLSEYKTNMAEFSKQEVRINTVHKDRLKYIKESVDENSTCEDIVDNLDHYSF